MFSVGVDNLRDSLAVPSPEQLRENVAAYATFESLDAEQLAAIRRIAR